MEKQTRRIAAEMCGAVIGAGFASGREIDAFFTRFGRWGWGGVAAAVLVIGAAALGVMRHPKLMRMGDARGKGWMARGWRWAFAALMVVTGGAMMAAAGEIAALTLPMHGAYGFGMASTLLLAWLLAGRELAALPAISKGLIICLIAMVAAGAILPAQKAVIIAPEMGWQQGIMGILHGVCYGGLNAALAAPVMAVSAAELPEGEKKRCAWAVAGVLAILLAGGNVTLMRHTALQGESLPFIRLMAGWGKAGYLLGAASLYLAMLTTLTAALRGLAALLPAGGWWRIGGVAGIALVALTGFEGIVARAYPFLGGGCFVLLAAALCGEKT